MKPVSQIMLAMLSLDSQSACEAACSGVELRHANQWAAGYKACEALLDNWAETP